MAREPQTGYTLETRVLPGARYRATIATPTRERLMRYLSVETAGSGITHSVIVMLGAIGDEPPYMAALYPQFETQGGLSEISANLAPVGLPGFRPLARFMYHRSEGALVLYFLPRDVPPDPALAERVMSDVLTGQVLDMHVNLGRFALPGMQSRDKQEYDVLWQGKPVLFGPITA